MINVFRVQGRAIDLKDGSSIACPLPCSDLREPVCLGGLPGSGADLGKTAFPVVAVLWCSVMGFCVCHQSELVLEPGVPIGRDVGHQDHARHLVDGSAGSWCCLVAQLTQLHLLGFPCRSRDLTDSQGDFILGSGTVPCSVKCSPRASVELILDLREPVSPNY